MDKKQITMPSHDDSSIIGFGFTILFIVFGLIGGWMAYAPLASSSVAVGKVSADLEKKTIQHLEGGRISAIFVKDGDVVKKGDVLLKLQDIQARGQIEQIQKQIDGANSLIDTKHKRIDSLNEELGELEKLYAERLIDKVRIRELQREENIIEGDILGIKSEIAKLKEQIIIIEDILSRTSIVAPIDGIVVGLELNTIGGILNPGQPILEIVPQDSKLLVLCQVKTTDIDKVKVGLLADISFSAFNLQQSHVVEGKVIHVSADSFLDEASGMPYYEAKIEVTQKGIEQLDEYGFILVSGMPADIMIKIGDRTALSYLIKPFKDMLTRSFNEE